MTAHRDNAYENGAGMIHKGFAGHFHTGGFQRRLKAV
jgi:hypothetical protein